MKKASLGKQWYAEDRGISLPEGCDKPVSAECLRRALNVAVTRGDSVVVEKIKKILDNR